MKTGILSRVAAVVALSGVFALAACETPQQVVSQNEDNLSAAGFMVRPANNPKRQEMLDRLPPHQFVRRVHGDTVVYVYSDPLVCDCLYVGSEQAYNSYKLYLQQKAIANQQEMTAEDYSDAEWDWGAWGPWGGWGAGYGWGGRGWR